MLEFRGIQTTSERAIRKPPHIPSPINIASSVSLTHRHNHRTQSSNQTNSQSKMSEALNRDYVVGPEIGRGRFGAVYRCSSVSTDEAFAVKSIDKSLISDSFDLASVLAEPKLTLLAGGGSGPHGGNNSNNNIVRLHDVYEDATSLHMVLDLCPGPDLFDRISDRAPLPEAEAASIMASLMQALAGCHRRGVAHGDVKPDNILFDGSGRLRLADFGSAGYIYNKKQMTGLVGTAHYVAPEVVRGEEYGEKVDVWSAGVVLYAMLGGSHPFAGEDAGEIFGSVLRGNLRFPTRVFGWVSREAKDLMRKMMCRDPDRRLSAEQVLRHPWIKSAGGVRSL